MWSSRTEGRGGPRAAAAGASFCIGAGYARRPDAAGAQARPFCTVVSVTDTGDGDLVSFEGIDDLTAAEGITGCYVLANRDDFELDSLDAAYTDLMGREVVDERLVRSARLSRSCRRPPTMFGLSRAIGTASADSRDRAGCARSSRHRNNFRPRYGRLDRYGQVGRTTC
ncbi:MAG: hypothetical protein ACLTYW_01630 [Collinsella sp.]